LNWILFGFKAAGKTYFGKQLNLPFIDTDILIEQIEKKSIREIVQQKGEIFFRYLEKKVIRELHVANHVFSVGGGAVLDPENLAHLQALGKMLYLKCPKEVLKERMLKSTPTFLDLKNLEYSFEKHYSTRISKYEKIPSILINLKDKTDTEILEELWQVINLEISFESLLGENLTVEQ